MSDFQKAFNAGAQAVRSWRGPMLILVCVSIGITSAVFRVLAGHYIMAGLTLVFFCVFMPWLGWNWIKPRNS